MTKLLDDVARAIENSCDYPNYNSFPNVVDREKTARAALQTVALYLREPSEELWATIFAYDEEDGTAGLLKVIAAYIEDGK